MADPEPTRVADDREAKQDTSEGSTSDRQPRAMNNFAVTAALAEIARKTDGPMEVPLTSELWPVVQISDDEVIDLAEALERVEAEDAQRAA
jgi:hypothetical protein